MYLLYTYALIFPFRRFTWTGGVASQKYGASNVRHAAQVNSVSQLHCIAGVNGGVTLQRVIVAFRYCTNEFISWECNNGRILFHFIIDQMAQRENSLSLHL